MFSGRGSLWRRNGCLWRWVDYILPNTNTKLIIGFP